MTARGLKKLVGVLAVGAVIFAACGSDGDDSATSNGNGGSGSTPVDVEAPERCEGEEASGDPVKVGIITTLTSPVTNTQDMVDGLQAGIDCVNAGGGLNGRPLELEVCDDKGDAAAAKTCAQDLVDDGIVAVLSGYSIAGAAEIQPVLEAAGVPRIGHQPLGAPDFASPMSFPLAGGGAAYAPAVARFIREQTEHAKIGYAAPNLDIGRQTAETFIAQVTDGDREVETKMVTFDTSAQDFGPVITALTAGFQPDAIVYGAGSGQAAPFLKALQAAGLQDIDVYLSCGASSPDVLQAAGDAAKGRIYACDTYNPFVAEFADDPATGVQDFLGIMDAFAPDALRSALAQFGVAAAVFVADVVDEMGEDAEITADALIEQIKQLQDFPVVTFHPYSWNEGEGSQATFPQVTNTFQTLARYNGEEDWELVSEMVSGIV